MEDSDEDDEVLKSYKNMHHLDNDDEMIQDDLDDDPLSKALRYIRQQRDLLKSGNPEIIEEESRLKAWVEMDELTVLLEEEVMQKGVRRWVRFDLLFGMIIVMNGIFMGLTTQGIVSEDDVLATVVETTFLSIFAIEWMIRWYFKPTGFRGMMTDPWTCFDFFIIVISFIDMVILGVLDLEFGASMITTLRVLRLFRLVRLVRLFKLLKKLWMLVSGMKESFRILFWSLIMLSLFCYIFGLFMLEIVRSSEMLRRKPAAAVRWGTVMGCMLSMAEIATHNGERLMMELINELGFWVLGVILIFVFIASLGLLNLVVAVQMTSSLNLAKKNTQYEDLIQRLVRHRALRRLRELLSERCVSTTGSTLVTRNLLNAWVGEDAPPASRAKSKSMDTDSAATSSTNPSASRTFPASANAEDSQKLKAFKEEMMKENEVITNSLSGKFSELSDYLSNRRKRKIGFAKDFFDAGISEDEIKMIFDEVDAVHGCEKAMSVDDFVDSCILLKSRVHELDFVKMSQAVHYLYWRLATVKSSLTQTYRALEESSDQVRWLLRKYHGSGKVKEGRGDNADWHEEDLAEEETTENLNQKVEEVSQEVAKEVDRAKKDDREKLVLRNAQEALLITQETNRAMEVRNWDRFDSMFAVVVLLNTAIFGVEAVMDTSSIERDFRSNNFDTVSMVWFILDFFFLSVYIIELVFRTIYHYQMEVQRDFRTFQGVLPKLAFVMDRRSFVNIIKSFPRWLKNLRNFMLIDTLVVVSGILDNLVLRLVGMSSNYRKFMRLGSMLRFLRLIRLLHLLRPLSVLLKAFISNAKIISWSLVMLGIMVYAGSIAMVSLVGQDEANQQDAVVMQKWGRIGPSMLTLSEMVLFTNWGTSVQELQRTPIWIRACLLVFVGITSLGILNLVVGVMVQVAFYTVVSQNQQSLSRKLHQAKGHIQEAITKAVAKESAKRDAAKAELQIRIRLMRQDQLESKVASEVQERQRLSKSGSFVHLGGGQAKLKRSVGRSMGTRDQLTHLSSAFAGVDDDDEAELDEEQKRKQDSQKPRSVLNARNYCTVVHCFWMATGELCIGISSSEPSTRHAVVLDVMCAALIWDGGRANPVIFIPDEEGLAAGELGVIRRGSADNGNKKDMRMTATKSLNQGKRIVRHLGDLFFGKVPMGTDLCFQYAANYSTVRVYPIKSPLTWDNQILLADVVPVDMESLTISQLREIMQDPQFIRHLGLIGLRPEQAFMTYSTLNVVSTGNVKVADFIEGLLRLRRQDVGLDTAGAKSLLRRLMRQVTNLATDSVTCNMCFSNAVQQLHGVSILEKDEGNDPYEMVDEDSMVADHQGKISSENVVFRRKLERLTAYVAEKKERLGIKGNLGFGRCPVDVKDDDEMSIAMSITSASPGWD